MTEERKKERKKERKERKKWRGASFENPYIKSF